jgi:hypothetical protein
MCAVSARHFARDGDFAVHAMCPYIRLREIPAITQPALQISYGSFESESFCFPLPLQPGDQKSCRAFGHFRP